MMKTEILTVTPEMAARWLSNNPNVRSLRQRRIDGLVRAIKCGEFKMTHQGIAIDAKGALLDGQHRLAAIIKAGTSVQIMVTTGISREIMDAVDGGLPRTAAERLGTDRLDTQIASSMLSILTNRTPLQGFEIEICLDIINPFLRECESTIPSWRGKNKTGSASALAAMVLLVASKKNDLDVDEMKLMMGKALSGDLFGAPQSVIIYYKQMYEGVQTISLVTKGGSSLTSRFCRAWVAMQPKNKNLKIIMIRDTKKIIADAIVAFNDVTSGVFN